MEGVLSYMLSDAQHKSKDCKNSAKLAAGKGDRDKSEQEETPQQLPREQNRNIRCVQGPRNRGREGGRLDV